MSPICSCVICRKQYSSRGIHTHHIFFHTKEGNDRVRKNGLKGSSIGANSTKIKFDKIKKDLIIEYMKHPNQCPICESIIPFAIRNNKCCSTHCAGKLANKTIQRTGWSDEQKYNNKERLKKKKEKKNLVEQRKIVRVAYDSSTDPWSTVIFNTCAGCSKKWTHHSRRKFCSECGHKYSHNGRSKYWFTFNLFYYPDLFDLSLITTIGFRDSKTNPNGITRDHRISVAHAIKYDYDPYYIKHPLNCELMRFDENNKKKTKSSISFDELKRLVDEYDNIIR